MPLIVRQGAYWFRRHVRRVWQSRGGGFYGFVATLTFLYLEAVNVIGDIGSLRGLGLNLGWVINFLVQNFVQGILNVVWASVWPVAWIQRFGVGLKSAALLVGCYFTFRLIQPMVARLLQEPGETGMLGEPTPFATADRSRSPGTRPADREPLRR